jgi:hypothetical protein
MAFHSQVGQITGGSLVGIAFLSVVRISLPTVILVGLVG